MDAILRRARELSNLGDGLRCRPPKWCIAARSLLHWRIVVLARMAALLLTLLAGAAFAQVKPLVPVMPLGANPFPPGTTGFQWDYACPVGRTCASSLVFGTTIPDSLNLSIIAAEIPVGSQKMLVYYWWTTGTVGATIATTAPVRSGMIFDAISAPPSINLFDFQLVNAGAVSF
jgi:hypothetical protein